MVLISTIFLGIIKLQMRIDGKLEKGLFVRTKKFITEDFQETHLQQQLFTKQTNNNCQKKYFKMPNLKESLACRKV
jgi:hypothetical protein